MSSTFNQLCPRFSGPLTLTLPLQLLCYGKLYPYLSLCKEREVKKKKKKKMTMYISKLFKVNIFSVFYYIK